MISRVFNQIWICAFDSTPTPPQDIDLNIKAWKLRHPRHIHRLWTLPLLIDLCKNENLEAVAAAINLCRFPSMQADIGRLVVLHLFGGYWIDLKLYPLQSFVDTLEKYDLVLTEHFVKPDLPDPKGHISSSFIGAIPRHPIVSAALYSATMNVLQRKAPSIYHVTGATNLMKAVERPIWKGNYRLLAHQEAWGSLFNIRGGSYNLPGMHWSQREALESPYKEV